MIKLKEILDHIGDISKKSTEEISKEDFEKLQLIVKKSGINILSDKELYYAIYVNDVVVGGLYTSFSNDIFSFDIVVDEKYRRQGLGKTMIDDAISEFKNSIMDVSSDAKIELDVVNKNLVSYLKTKGFTVTNTINGHIIMSM